MRKDNRGWHPRELCVVFAKTKPAIRNALARLRHKGLARSDGMRKAARYWAIGTAPDDQRGLAETTRLAMLANFGKINAARAPAKVHRPRTKPGSALDAVLRQAWV